MIFTNNKKNWNSRISWNEFHDRTFLFITYTKTELETPGWNQVEEDEKLFPDLMYLLKFD